jgi:hypothetical protein
MGIDPDGKLLRKSLEIGMTREEAEEWLRNVEAAGDVDAVHIARAMRLAFFMRQAQAIGCDPTEYLEGFIQYNETGVITEVPQRYPVTRH